MTENTKNLKFFILKRNNRFEFMDLNDLAVDIAAGEVFSNSLIFDDTKGEWVTLFLHEDIPQELKNSANILDDTPKMPDFILLKSDTPIIDKNLDLEIVKEKTHFISEKIEQSFLKEVEILHLVKKINSEFSRFVDTSSAINEDREKVEILTSKLTNAVIENDVLKDNLKKSLLKIEILQNRVNENETLLEKEERQNEVSHIESFEELQNGKTYEFLNVCEWLLLKENKSQGPIRFDELLDHKKSGFLIGAKVRRVSELHWREIEDVIELSSAVVVVNENLKIPEKNIYRVERGEYRAEVRQAVTFEFMDVEYKGILSNISLTGGFIELFKTEEFENAIDKTSVLYLNEGLVSESIFCNIKIKRISKNRPKGFGFSFVNVTPKNLEILGKLIAEKINTKKAA